MNFSATHIASLILKKISGQLTEVEAAHLEEWRNASAYNQQQYDDLLQLHTVQQELQQYRNAQQVGRELAVPSIQPNETIELTARPDTQPVRRVRFLGGWGWAAAILVLLGAGAYLLLTTQKEEPTIAHDNPSLPKDILPGTNRAVLSIDDKPIDLASNQTGIQVGDAITYNDGARIADAGQMLQLITPRGGQYQAVLPDGSKVWLNAASSIRFPSKFAGNAREVTITGEYLEIAKNNQQPFTVTANKTTIAVLGTSFNVNAYDDEAALTTTLVDGSIKVLAVGKELLLQPGQQAVITDKSLKTQPANIQQALAWKNGLFNIDGAELQTVLRQLARWYDITIQYPGTLPVKYFQGELDRGLSLNQMIEALSQIQPTIGFKLEGRTLLVQQKSK